MDSLTAQERLVLIRVKIERAKKHLDDFESQAERFRNAYTNVIGTHRDEKRAMSVQYFTKLPVSRFDVLAAAGDVLQNLRSALDHLALHLIEAGIGRRAGENIARRSSFPISRTAKEYERLKTRKIKGARKSAIKAIDKLKPYKSGNRSLWFLHHLNNIDKHRHIISVGSNYLFEGAGFDGHYWHKAAKPLFHGIFGTEVNQNAKVVVKKSLGKSGIIEGEPLLPFLHEMVKFVDDLIGGFEWHLRPRKRRSRFP